MINGKLVKTSMGYVGVSKETVVNVEINWYTVWLTFLIYYSDEELTSETSVLSSQPHGVPIYFYIYNCYFNMVVLVNYYE